MPKLTRNCENCNKEFQYWPYEIKRRFCSSKCVGQKIDPNIFINKRFGDSVVIEFLNKRIYTWGNRTKTLLNFNVKCDCGNIRQANHWDLKAGKSDRCKTCAQSKRLNIKSGDKFGKWTVLEEASRYFDQTRQEYSGRQFRCECECGQKTVVLGFTLKNKTNTQCNNCRMNNSGTHKLSYSSTYKSWRGLLGRCFTKQNASYYNYGGRGIIVCDRWLKFENFYEDMGEKPEKRMSIDRIDPDGNYEPNNCRWVTHKENTNNRRNSKKNNHLYTLVKNSDLCDKCLSKINTNIKES